MHAKQFKFRLTSPAECWLNTLQFQQLMIVAGRIWNRTL